MNAAELIPQIETNIKEYLIANKSIENITSLLVITHDEGRIHYYLVAKRPEDKKHDWHAIELNHIAKLNPFKLLAFTSIFEGKIKSFFEKHQISQGQIRIQHTIGKNQYFLYKGKTELVRNIAIQEIL